MAKDRRTRIEVVLVFHSFIGLVIQVARIRQSGNLIASAKEISTVEDTTSCIVATDEVTDCAQIIAGKGRSLSDQDGCIVGYRTPTSYVARAIEPSI